MPKVVADISMSLDGFVTGPEPDLEQGLGRDGEALHEWVFEGNDLDARILSESTDHTGAVIMGRRLLGPRDAHRLRGRWGWRRGALRKDTPAMLHP